MIIKKIDFSDFLEEFKKYNREDVFTYQGKKALFEYLNELSESIGQPIELDIIDICCNFTEYNNLQQFMDDYGYTIEDIEDIEEIQEHTTLIKINEGKGFIIQDF